ncbi:MAG: signal recognition particle-docking protein FtsY [Ilumatobacteraceae bacterium]
MLASSIVNYGVPAAIVVVLLLLGIVAFRLRRGGVSGVAESDAPSTSASSSLADSSLIASSNVPNSATTPADVEEMPDSAGDTVDDDSLELAKRVESIGVAGADAGEEVAKAEAAEEEEVATVRERTGRTRSLFSSAFASIRGKGRIDDATWDELEETLLRADIGIGLTTKLLDPLRAAAKAGEIKNADEAIAALRVGMTQQLSSNDRSLLMNAAVKPNVWLFVGVNGVGKTTTIGKIATAEVGHGTSVLLAAGDTFRAAAAEQLQVWAERSGAAFVRGSEGGDPASVIFDGIQSAHARDIQLVLGDTAGRLQNKSNLMEELKKVRRVAEKAEGTVNEVLLVIDATTGQNGLSQAREFAAATDVTGVVLTKLDGSAKGGIVFAIETELGIPVKLVGLGEGARDLVAFNPEEYVAALFE